MEERKVVNPLYSDIFTWLCVCVCVLNSIFSQHDMTFHKDYEVTLLDEMNF